MLNQFCRDATKNVLIGGVMRRRGCKALLLLTVLVVFSGTEAAADESPVASADETIATPVSDALVIPAEKPAAEPINESIVGPAVER